MNQQDDEVRLLRKDSMSTDNEILVPATPIDRSNEYETRRERRSSDIAIIGLSGRFASSANLEVFWDHLQKGHSCIEEIQRKGWETGTHSGPDFGHSHTSQVKWGGMLQNIDQFDPLFFNISPLEAAKMDPQQRLFLEEAYKAFEDAGYSAEQLSEKKVGVFVGARSSDYKEQALRGNGGAALCACPHTNVGAAPYACPMLMSSQEDQIDAHLFLGNDMAILAARISYFLNLKGPNLTIDTASSSSLVAIHLACESIHTGESEMALAGGVFVMSSPEYALMAAKTQMLSPDGKCKTFDKSANGIVIGEGVGALVLKPLDAAIEDRDHIYGIILGSAMNQDGKTFGMTAPSLLSQKDLLVSLYKKAAIHPETVSYIEAHGTGSKLGDPIEVQALTEAFRAFTNKKQFCAIGSHKPNIGHTISSAGIAGVLKILLAMKYQQLPPTINVEEINPEIDFQCSPFFLNTELSEWKRCDGNPRRAGISSFGLSGTNCHLILEEPPVNESTAREQAGPAFFFPLSARTGAALRQKVEDMLHWLEKEGEKYAVEDIAYTLVQGRSHFAVRSAVVAKDTNELKEYLRAIMSKGGSEQAEINTKGHGSEPTELLFNEYGAWLLQELCEYDTSDQNGYKEKITVLANMYVKGYNLDWSQLFQKGRHFRVPLPTYPFSRESYWLETTPRDQSRHLLDGYAGTLSGTADSGREGGQVQGTASTALQSGVGWDTPNAGACPYPLPLREALSHVVSSLLKVRVGEIDAETPLSEYGFDSITFTEFANRLNQTYQLDLTPAHFFEYSTLERLAQYLHAHYASTLASYFGTSARKGGLGWPQSGDEVSPLRASVTSVTSIAIIGMSGSFPQAPDVQSLWNNLLEGKDCIGEIPASRWNWQAYFGNPTTEINRTNIKWAGIVEEVEQFDPLFFGISPREAEQMDPQQRLLMMYVWKAMEDAGYAASSLSGTNTALFVGTTNSGYGERVARANMVIEGYSATGQTPSVGPNRMSYFLNLHGPSEAIETACSSSLIAIHRGVNAIESGQCTLAIVGGVNTLVSPELHISYSKAGMLSEDGRCKTFSAQANGYVRGEGIGMLVLKKLSDAEQAGDHIYGVIRGSAENHGGRASSLTAPNPRAQADLLIAAYRKAGIDPCTVGYIEAHGTGTALGDPIEINGLKTAFSELWTDTRHSSCGVAAGAYSEEGGSIPQAWCGIGSVKSNIGHLELAAGVAGVIKVLLQLRYKKLVKSLHCEQLNPYIQLEGSPFYVVQETRPWEALRDDEGNALPRRAGVSSFGFGGVNAHIVLEEYIPNLQAPHHIQSPTQPPGWEQAPPLPIVLSARTEERLHEQARQLLAWLQAGMYTEEPLGQGQDGSEARFLRNLAYTLQVGREAMEERLASQVSSLAELEEKLHRYVEGVQEAGDWYRGQVRQHKEAVALLSTDEEFPETIGKWFQRGKYDKLLSWWVKGLRIDWQPLYTVGAWTEVVGTGQGQALSLRSPVRIPTTPARPRRISLPTYPFARERYWIPVEAELSVARGAQAEQGQALPATDKTNGNRVALRPLADPPQSSMQEPRTLPTSSDSALSITSGHLLAPTLQAPQIEEELVRSLAQALYIEEGNIDVEKPFGEMGLDSVIGVEWIQSLNKQYASHLKASSIYDYPTIRQLASFLQKGQYHSIINVGTWMGANPIPTDPVQEMVACAYRTDTNEADIRTQTGASPVSTDSEASSPSGRNEAIAIVGMSGKYPDARNLSEYWDNLVQGKNGIREIPLSRFNVSDYYDPSPARSGKIYCKWLGVLDEIEYFDPLFFQLSPAEAEGMDPQQRLFLEEGYKAFEDAGYSPRLLSNSKCGIYLGVMSHEYGLLLHQQRASEMSLLGGSSAIAAARIAYHLNLKGPAIAIDTACSSSLVAIHLACQALRCQEIDMALVGGVSLYLTPDSYMGMCSAGMLSADGQCRTFDASANGFVPGEGVGALVLKRLADAEADHDQIYGVIIGSGMNQDGATNGITAPSVKSQIELEREIYEKYQIDPESISYVEMHGTGTKLGDPIELEALAAVFQERTQRKQYCAIGSVKTNIGHTSAAAGVAGLQKVLLAMKYKKLVPILHFEQPNPHFDFAASPFYVNTEVQDWKSASGTPLRAAVSAFGFSGTNAHLVLEEYIPASFPSHGVEDGDLDTSPDGGQPYPPLRSPGSRLFVLSARSEQQLASYAQEMKRWLQAHAELALMDVAFTLQLGREAMEYRLAILADSREVLLQRLDQFVNKQASPGLYTAQVKKGSNDATFFEADEDGQSLLHIWCQKKNLAKIAQVWVRGVNIDWVLLYKGGVVSVQDTGQRSDGGKPHPTLSVRAAPTFPYRISLPTYPFARERYWIPIQACRNTDGGKPTGHATLHSLAPVAPPLVQRNTSTLWEQRFSSTFHGDEFFLADHIVKGQRIMPGAAYLEMACAAVREAIGATAEHELRCLRLSHVVWARPLVVDEQPVTVRIALSPQENGTIAFLISRDLACVPCATEGSDPPEEKGTEQVYCQGIAELHTENTVRLSVSQSLDLPAVQARCQHQISAAECYQRYRELSLNYGSAFQGIEQLSRGEGEVLAKFRLPSMVAQTPTEEGRRDADRGKPCPYDYVLHPSVLDAALQASLGLLIESHKREVLHLPFALDELSIVGEVPTEGWAWVRRSPGPWACPRGTAGLDSEDRASLLDIEVCDDAGHIALRLRGLSMRPPGSRFEFLRTVLLLPNWKEQEAPLPTGETGADISLMVPVMPSLAPVTQSLVLLCGLSGILASRIEAKLASGGRCRNLSSEAPRRELRFQDMAWQLMQELQYLLRKRPVGPVFVQVVVVRWGEPSLLDALAGVLRAAQQEYPKLVGQLIEIEGEPEEGQLLAWLAENQERPADAHIRYRNGQRWVREWQEQLDRTPAAKIPWKEGGCYLITGGAGGLGRLFVREMAQHVETATIILVGRSALSASQRAQLVPENGGIHIDCQQVDVSDGPAVHTLIQRVLAKSGHLDGIIHAAGVLRDSLLLNKTQENVRAVLAPKVMGVEHLDEASRDIPLDFFILCSSLSAVAGNVGQADYAAANAYLDAFAHARRALVEKGERVGTTLSINWPLWEEGGMRIEAETVQRMRERLGIEVMDAQTGMKMLYQALSCGQAQVMVAHGQVERIKQPLRQISVGADRAGLTQQEQQETTLLGQETLRERASTYFKKQLATVIKLPVQQIDIEAPLENYGFDSILAIRFTNALEDSFGPLSKTLLFEYPTIQSVTEYFLHRYPEQLGRVLRIEEAEAQVIPQISSNDLGDERPADPGFAPKGDSNHLHHRLALLRKGVNPFPTNESVCDALARQDKETRVDDIAIIGLAGRYPGARDVRTFWENLCQGRDCLSEIPRERWDHRLYFDADKNKVGTTYSKWGGFLEGVDEFDPLFFNISPQEAERMDPQERLFLECVYATIEDAGYTRQGLSLYQRNGLHGSVGVFVGVMYEEYQLFGAQAQIQGRPIAVAGNPSSIANRVSYFCNFHGPSLAVDTMCSSSLTAIHLACQSIQQGECALAIAGGVNVSIHPNKYLLLGQSQFVSSQGHCESFGVGADGYVPAEGVGAVLLKPRVLAEADGDHIYGVIKATAINHGGKTNGYTVPNPQAQAEVIGQALKDARIDPETISYIEAHGTGTVLGDPIEIAGLVRAFEQGRQDNVASGSGQGTGRGQAPSVPTAPGWCAIGSVKSNIGHAESAAGIAGVTKVLLQMRYRQLVPSLHSEVLNPHIDFSATPFVVQQELSPWKRLQMPGTSEGKELPRRAGISSFGAGGANAHVILEEYVEREQENDRRKERSSGSALIVLSARTEERLKEQVRQLLSWIQREEAVGLDNLAYTLQVGREAMEERLALQVSSLAELEEKLRKYLQESQEGGDWYRGQVVRHDGISVFATDEDSQKTVTAWMNKGKYEKLLQWWVKGGTIDWKHLYGECLPRRISLPTYPFARERYWLTTSTVGTRRDSGSSLSANAWPVSAWGECRVEHLLVPTSHAVLHPLVQRNTSTLWEQQFSSTFRGDEFFLSDHVICGQRMMPAVAYLEMARTAVTLALGDTVPAESICLHLTHVVWARPLVCDPRWPVSVQISLSPQDKATLAFVISRDSARQEQGPREEECAERVFLCQGTAELHAPLASIPSVDMAAVQRRCQRITLSGAECYQRFGELSLRYGPALQGIEQLNVGEDEVLARLCLPETVMQTHMQGDHPLAYVLHPGLLDAAFQACIGLLAKPVGRAQPETSALETHVPFELEALEIVGRVKASGWAWVRRRTVGTGSAQGAGWGQAPSAPTAPVRFPASVFDIEVCDDEGQVAVRLRGLSTRVLGGEEEWRTVLLTPGWKEEKSLMHQLEASPEPSTSVASNPLVLLCGLPKIEAARIQSQMASGSFCRRLRVNVGHTPLSRREQRFQEAVVQLIQQLQDVFHSRPAEPLLVQVVVGSPEEPSFLEALTGVLKTAQLEYPKLLGQLIEVEGELEEEELLVLLRENQQWPQELHIRYRDSKRWVRHWQELPLLSVPPKVPWKEGGCYLISGGAGGLGRLFVQEIVRHVQQATVILVGRSELSQELRAHLKQGGSTGLHIDYQQVDVSDGLAVHALIQRVLEQYGHLDGIIHAAGVLRDSLLLNKTQKQVQEVLAPKVMGVEHLDEASREIPLDVFILCSSLSAVLGNVGQADYAAANAYLDAFAHKRQARVLLGTRQGTTLSINWPLWEEGGMQIEAETIQIMRERLGIEVMETQTGMKMLYQALVSGFAQVLVTHGQVERVKQRLQYRSPEPPGVVGQAQGAVPTFADRVPTDPDREVWQDRLREALARMVSDVLKVRVEEIDAETLLSEYGFDSVTLTQLANRLNQSYGLDLTPALFFEHSTLSRLAQYLQATSAAVLAPHFALTSPATSGRSQGINRVLAPEVKLNEVREAASWQVSRLARWLLERQPTTASPIAIIGMSGAFPQAPDVQSLWSHLLAGKDCISEIPASRWDWQSYFGHPDSSAEQTNIKRAGVMEGIDLFDPLFFGISPREAEQMDPQQRLLMMYVWKAIEDAGYSASSLSGSNTALFVGTTSSGYSEIVYRANREIDGYSSTGQASSVGPGRMSYFLNLHGPSEPIETACSSSLVVIHRGVNAIESGQCSMAIVGGINILISPETHISFSKAGMLSEDGRCKSFSAQANGYVRGEGVGMLVLKKLSDAERAGDHIYAVIRGSAENHGGRASSLTAPNPRAQADLLVAAYRKAGIDPRTVGYIEAHGTGTPLGDPVEINALKTAWSELRTGAKPYNGEEKSIPQAWCGIGSVKSNIGHLELAAGVAGVIKVVLQLQHRQLVKSLHCEQLNPYIQLEESPFYIVQKNQEWEALHDDEGNVLPRRAGVSSFGFGGVNAHVVLEEYVLKPQEKASGSGALPGAIIVLSARTEERLQEQVRQLLNWIDVETRRDTPNHRKGLSLLPLSAPDYKLQDLAYTLQVGREAMEERLALQVSSLAELEEKLDRYLQEPQEKGDWYRGQVRRHEAISVFTADEDGQKAVTAWISKGKYGKLLELWVKGLTINWEHLYKQERPRRISLPTYPFARERYWISRGVSGDVDGGKPDPYGWSPTSLTILHPLVQCNISDFFEQRFSSTFDGEEFFLADHVIFGQRVMPGVVYLEMARTAIALAMRSAVQEEEHILRLSQMVWIRPLVIGKQPVEVHITLELQESQQVVFTISSQIHKTEGEARDIVCQGKAEIDVEEEVAQSLDLTAIQTRCQRFTLSAKECYQRFSELSMSYGPAMQGLEQLSIGEGEVLARLRLPVALGLAPRAQTSTEGRCPPPYVLHPSVLDAALQACIGLQADLNAYQNPQAGLSQIGLPFALDEFSVVGDVPTQGWSWVRLHPGHVGQVFDIDVCDDAGCIAVRLRGLSIRQIPASAEESQTVLSTESATEEVGETYV